MSMKNGHQPRTLITMLNAYSKLAAEREVAVRSGVAADC